jgi:hypothetical protein
VGDPDGLNLVLLHDRSGARSFGNSIEIASSSRQDLRPVRLDFVARLKSQWSELWWAGHCSQSAFHRSKSKVHSHWPEGYQSVLRRIAAGGADFGAILQYQINSQQICPQLAEHIRVPPLPITREGNGTSCGAVRHARGRGSRSGFGRLPRRSHPPARGDRSCRLEAGGMRPRNARYPAPRSSVRVRHSDRALLAVTFGCLAP